MATDQRAFVLLHGFSGSPASWRTIVDALPLSARVFCPAIVGHAADTGPALDFVAEVDRLAARIAQAGVREAHLCGYSLGARLALGLLLRHPTWFVRATLISANPGLAENSAERVERVASDERWAQLAETDSDRFFAQWSAQPLFGSQRAVPDAVRAEQERVRFGHDPHALAGAMRVLSLGRMPDWRPHLNQIPIPVAVMAGGLDNKFTGLAREMAQTLPNARLEIVPDSGHNIPLERPSAIIAALLAGE